MKTTKKATKKSGRITNILERFMPKSHGKKGKK